MRLGGLGEALAPPAGPGGATDRRDRPIALKLCQTHFGAIQGLNFAFSLISAETDLECALPKLAKFESEIHVNVKAMSFSVHV